jgi:hypothetical protein
MIEFRKVWGEIPYWLIVKIFRTFHHTEGFATYELFAYHYKKHVIKQNEFGRISKREYARRADEIWGGVAVPANHFGPPTAPLEECTRGHDGARLRYDNNANELGILHGATIGTFFRPTQQRAKFLKECRR